MSISDTIVKSSRASTPLAALVNSGCKAVGGIFRLDYARAVVLTDDWRKSQAGGVPHGAFLLAAAGAQTTEGFALDDEELILLRVDGTAPLPNETDLVQTRLAVVRDAGDSGKGFDDVTDELTRNELQQSAFDCEVLGTFYTEPTSTRMEFGSDIDNVVSSARYQVFLPSQEVLSRIASYPEPSTDDILTIGVVRFASTRRRSRAAGVDSAEVHVHIDDFVARKTAVFGMTRTGKSNTIKTLVTAVYQHSMSAESKIGQLIFDPQGEYANENTQDQTGLRLLGDSPDEVRVYKERPDPSKPIDRALRINFLDPATLSTVWAMVQQEVAESSSSGAQYMAGFRGVSMEEPDPSDFSALNHFERNRLAFYALLERAGISGPLDSTRVTLGTTLIGDLPKGPAIANLTTNGRYAYLSHTSAAKALLEWLQQQNGSNSANMSQSWTDDFNTGELADILKAMEGRAGDAAIKRLKPFHDPTAIGDIGELVWDDMIAGRLVIIDLSQGNGTVVKTLSERVVTTLLNHARDDFADGKTPIPFQIVVEEAHNLFERGAKEVAGNPWVRLSKEAAKYKIGLMYATQEVSSVDQRILSNTSNWLVAHLNSDNETRELSHYYDFKTWAESIRRVEDQGFVRMKTYSGKYIVPVQIAKFDHAMINVARVAAGLQPIEAG
ncbi:ATP-binding protein [Demequina aurantiaca]|uniref:ATP-binding protein n=1 Tax=Demequina aurantiaca TaxID=676200 RepID=UPI003D340C4E